MFLKAAAAGYGGGLEGLDRCNRSSLTEPGSGVRTSLYTPRPDDVTEVRSGPAVLCSLSENGGFVTQNGRSILQNGGTAIAGPRFEWSWSLTICRTKLQRRSFTNCSLLFGTMSTLFQQICHLPLLPPVQGVRQPQLLSQKPGNLCTAPAPTRRYSPYI